MFDVSSLPVPGGLIVSGALYAGLSAFVLGPVVADRTIAKLGWSEPCAENLITEIERERPAPPKQNDMTCSDLASFMGPFGFGVCENGGGVLIELLKIDPAAAAKEKARQLEAARINRIVDQAPNRCTCAETVVANETMTWALFAGSARLIGGPDDLEADLNEALHAPRCARLGEG